MTKQEIISMIERAGFEAVERDTVYNRVEGGCGAMTNSARLLRFAFLILSIGASPVLAQRIGSEEYRVYATVLKNVDFINRRDGDLSKDRVILDRTEFVTESSASEGGKLFRSLERRNLRRSVLENKLARFGYRKTYHLVPRTEAVVLIQESQKQFDAVRAAAKIQALMVCGSSWKLFYKKYPDASGYTTLSRVGFSRGSAVVQVRQEFECGDFSFIYILKRIRGRWRIHRFYGWGGVA